MVELLNRKNKMNEILKIEQMFVPRKEEGAGGIPRGTMVDESEVALTAKFFGKKPEEVTMTHIYGFHDAIRKGITDVSLRMLCVEAPRIEGGMLPRDRTRL